MRDLIPDQVLSIIRDRLIAGIADAEAKFPFGAADEDALTGALGHAISTPGEIRHQAEGQVFVWRTYYQKLRGRGRGAPEKRSGADGVFQIELLDAAGRPIRRKGLPFQAKKGWSGRDRKLFEQANRMLQETGHGIIIDYSRQGYSACMAKEVLDSSGRKTDLRKANRLRDLGQILGHDFLDCTAGAQGLYYDPEQERFMFDEFELEPVGHLVATTIRRTGRTD